MKHQTREVYSAGLATYQLRCADCGALRGIHTSLRDALAAGAQHRRDMRALLKGAKP